MVPWLENVKPIPKDSLAFQQPLIVYQLLDEEKEVGTWQS